MGITKREGEALAEAGKSVDPLPPADLLAISGGGDAGAFAAGILAGWSAHGDRPEFNYSDADPASRPGPTLRLNGFSDWIQSSVRVLGYKEPITSATMRIGEIAGTEG
jgi:hypothetical protein